jgi:hypothetical protein
MEGQNSELKAMSGTPPTGANDSQHLNGAFSSPPYRQNDDDRPSPSRREMPPEKIIPDHEKSRLTEEARRVASVKGILLETINLLWREYHVKNLRFFRMRVEDAMTMQELEIAADMILTIGRFHEIAGKPEKGPEA